MDEFFMVRVSGLMDQQAAEFTGRDPAGLTAGEQLSAISDRVHQMVQKEYNCLNRSILPALEKEKIFFMDYKELRKEQKDYVLNYFDSTLYPILTPMAIDQSRPFPLLSNKSLNIIVELDDRSQEMYAVVQVPSVVSRCLELSNGGSENKKEYIFIEDIIKQFIHKLFNGHKVLNAYTFRITRNSDLTIDEEDTEDLLGEIERSIKRRKWGEPVRLEIERNISGAIRLFLETALELSDRDIYEISGPLDLTVCMKLAVIKGFDHLKNLPLDPVPSVDFYERDLFEAIREKDILLHHPYESFDAVVNFVKTASNDPDVLAIKQTLYRVSGNSPIVNALIQAAENGKQVTVLVELKARFDEENNIIWAKKLEKSGCHVVYGLVGLKTHCKLCLVVRRDEDGIRRYIHLGTGNYNDSTAKIYTDMGYFTCKETFGHDISGLFNVLTGYSMNLTWNKIAVAPISLRELFMKYISSEMKNANSGKPARIIAKMNSLVDTGIIQALYKASMAGVKIILVVRGICCLRPDIGGISENIQVVSIVDRFLEHSRIFYFENMGEPKIFLSSADWMPRNLDKRVEIAFPIEDQALKEKIFEMFKVTVNDTVKLRKLDTDGKYHKVDRRGKENVHSQLYFHKDALERFNAVIDIPVEEKFRPNAAPHKMKEE
jgi:polyphosphate kinase